MNRSVVALLALSVTQVIAAGCNTPDCAKGTVQKQDPDGTVHCVIADQPLDVAKCSSEDAIIVGGVCVSKRICDPATTMPIMTTDGKIVCLGIGGNNCTPRTPSAANISLSGNIYDWETGQKLAPKARRLKTQAHDPLKFLSGDRSGLGIHNGEDGCYEISDIPRPGSGLVAIAIDDPDGGADELILSASGAVIAVAGKPYKVDLYFAKKSLVEGWKTQSGVDYPALGAYIPCYYSDTAGADDDNTMAHATMPVSGVKIKQSGMVVASAKYFDNPLTVGTMMQTTANGCGIIPAPPAIDLFTGEGGMCKGAPCNWRQVSGASAPAVLFFTRFHQL